MTLVPWIRLQDTEVSNLETVLFVDYTPTVPVSFPYVVSSPESSVKVSKLSRVGGLRMAPRRNVQSEDALFIALVKEQCAEVGQNEKPDGSMLAASRPVPNKDTVLAPWLPPDLGIWLPKGDFKSPDHQASIGASLAVRAPWGAVRYAGFLANPSLIRWVKL